MEKIKSCKYCGIEVTLENSYKRNRRSCKKCHIKMTWGQYNNPNDIRFGSKTNKENVLLRDGYKCRICSMTNEEHLKKWGRTITIHHIDNHGRYSDIKNNKLDNLITLCLSCHGKEDVKARKINPVRIGRC